LIETRNRVRFCGGAVDVGAERLACDGSGGGVVFDLTRLADSGGGGTDDRAPGGSGGGTLVRTGVGGAAAKDSSSSALARSSAFMR
jgi:hypothetical protein